MPLGYLGDLGGQHVSLAVGRNPGGATGFGM